MRTPSIASAFYAPGSPPDDAAEMRRFLSEELAKIQSAFLALAAGHLDVTTSAPAKPRAGDIRYADGVQWKPNGTGAAGIWCYYNNTWNFLG